MGFSGGFGVVRGEYGSSGHCAGVRGHCLTLYWASFLMGVVKGG